MARAEPPPNTRQGLGVWLMEVGSPSLDSHSTSTVSYIGRAGLSLFPFVSL